LLRLDQLFLIRFILIFLAIFITSSIATYFWLKDIYSDQVKKELLQNIDIVSINIDSIKNLNDYTDHIKEKTGIRTTIIDNDGKVIAESDENSEKMDNHAQRIEVIKARNNGAGSSIRYSSTLKKYMVYAVKKIKYKNRAMFIRMSNSLDSIRSELISLYLQIFAIFTLFLVVGFIIIYRINLKIKDETKNILVYLSELRQRKSPKSIESNFCIEFNKITRLMMTVSTYLQEKQKQKIKQTAKLKLLNRQKDQIISAISHEFKNPIAVISGYSETLLNEQNLNDNLKKKFLKKIYNSSDAMNCMINRLRLAHKLEEGKEQLQLKDVELRALCNSCINELPPKYLKRGIEITGLEKILECDETLMKIAITNLIENGFKYSDDDIEIKINDYSLTVIDKGVGIEESEVENITKKFYRVSKHGWNNSLGLGLSIVKNILKLHGFQLEIHSSVNKGSTFKIVF
jgi:signal transduction histidine kinase